MPPKPKTPLVVEFTKEKETKNTVRYFESVDGAKVDTPAIGILYLQKTAVEALGQPEVLSITIAPT